MPTPAPSTDGIWIGHAWLDTSQLLPGPGPQGFSVFSNQEGPASFEFGTDETSDHTNHWDFGDGTLLNAPVGENVQHTYTTPGDYTVEVTCHGYTATCQVVAGDNPDEVHVIAVFINGPAVTVRVLEGMPNTHYRYEWGDGQNGDLTLDGDGHGEINHTYSVDGEYEAVGRNESTNAVVVHVMIVVATNVDSDKIITFGHTDLFYEFLLLNPDWSPVAGETLLWDFGDGVTAESTDSTLPVVHTFGDYGQYEVTCSWGSYAEHLLLDIVPPPFTPASVPGLGAWYDASDAGSFSYSSDTDIAEWQDRSGNGRHLTPGAPTTLQRNGTVNGLSAVTGNAGGRMGVLQWDMRQPVTVIAVAGATNAPGAQNSVLQMFPDGRIYRTTADDIAIWLIGGFSSSHKWSSAVHVVTVIYSTVSSKIGVDGGAYESGTVNPNDLYPGGNFQLAAELWPGNICEVLIYSRDVTDPERAQIESYLKAKWGTP